MANTPDYSCTRCGRQTSRDALSVKRVQFTDMGEGARTIRSRVCEWLCITCMEADPDYNRPKFSAPKVRKELV